MSLPVEALRLLAFRRRATLGGLVVGLLILAAWPMGHSLGVGGWSFLKILFFVLFLLLLTPVLFSSIVATVGWWSLQGKPDRAQLLPPTLAETPDKLPATAILMPIFNEETSRVFAGLRAMYESLQRTQHAGSFDVFILSDTNDTNCWIAEQHAWFELCKQVEGFGRIFYRKRRVQLHHKSGNIADFCRRWGANYRYMIVLDADSIMTGESMVRLVGLMEQRPRTGIIQTTTLPVLGTSLFQRMEQFAAFAYRPIFAAGASFWQLSESSFFGHNAVIRIKPFMEHCAMPELPEIGPLGTHILSHDTIEAALMRRGGYEVWQLPIMGGTFEEGPPHLIASLKRDRRWCHGNLQHVWFLFERGIKTVSRLNILNGILAYASSPLWLCSLILGAVIAVQNQHHAVAGTAVNPLYSSGVLYMGIMGVLFLPKLLGACLILGTPEKRALFKNRFHVLVSVALETFYSMILAPILMLFYTRFVLASLMGFKVGWGPQVRSEANGPGWATWFRVHAANTLFIVLAVAWMSWKMPSLLLWMIPVLAGPLLAVPFSKFTASQYIGIALRAHGWFITPQEPVPLQELVEVETAAGPEPHPFFAHATYASDYGLLQAVLDPYINAVHVSLLRQRAEGVSRTRDYMNLLVEKLLIDGPLSLTKAEKRALLWDAEAMSALHQKLWGSPAAALHEWWQGAFRNYVESTAILDRRTVSL